MVKKRNGSIKNVLMTISSVSLVVPLIIMIVSISISMNNMSANAQKDAADSLYSSIKDSVKNETQLMITGAEALYSKEKGTMPEKDLTKLVLDMVRKSKYGTAGYFFVYQYDGVRLVAPENPKQEGKNLINVTDKKGLSWLQV